MFVFPFVETFNIMTLRFQEIYKNPLISGLIIIYIIIIIIKMFSITYEFHNLYFVSNWMHILILCLFILWWNDRNCGIILKFCLLPLFNTEKPGKHRPICLELVSSPCSQLQGVNLVLASAVN